MAVLAFLDTASLLTSFHSTVHRRRPSPIIYLLVSGLLIFSLVRFEPRTNAAVGRASERLRAVGDGSGWKGWTAERLEALYGGGSRVAGGAAVDPSAIRKGKPIAMEEEATTDSCVDPNPAKTPTTELGIVADQVYDSVGPLCLDTYLSELDTFLLANFPSNRTSLLSPSSLRSLLRQSLASTLLHRESWANATKALPAIPKRIHQTNRYDGYRPPILDGLQVWEPWTWEHLNGDWTHEVMVDAEADEWVRQTFADPLTKPQPNRKAGAGKQRLDKEKEGSTGVLDAWKAMAPTPVMRSDFWRYLRLLVSGGTYADMDTKCLKPIRTWTKWESGEAGGEGKWSGAKGGPRFVVGIEADVGDREDWHKWWPRPIQIVQWTMSSSPGHPILLDTLRRILLSFTSHTHSASHDPTAPTPPDPLIPDEDLTISGSSKHVMSVVELTGPGPFTDSVLRYLGVMTEGAIRWKDLRSMPPEGLRVGDVLILPITAFSPGVGHMNAGEVSDVGAFVQHGFAGTWKKAPAEEK